MIEARVAAVFSDHMVIQRDREIPIWGWAPPDSIINIQLAESITQTTCPQNGKWMAKLPALKAGGPHVLTIKIQNKKTIEFKDVLIGEVWLASGQSNMQMRLSETADGERMVKRADVPQMRLLQVEQRYHPCPREDMASEGWKICSPENVKNFSAVAYYFGREIHEELDVPVGIIHASWGGTPIVAWTPLEALEGHDEFQYLIENHQKISQTDLEEEAQQREIAMQAYLKQTNGHEEHNDPGNQCESKGWAETEHPDDNWDRMQIPCVMEEAVGRPFDGEVWFRREVDIPDDWADKSADIYLGAIDDFDTTYINGHQVGSTGIEKENAFQYKRHYTIPKGLLKAGRNLIAVRVFDRYLQGGLIGPADKMYLLGPDRSRISLAGEWRYAISLELLQKPVPPKPVHHTASFLFNAMIHPLMPYPIRGAIWYQGENDVWQPQNYVKLTKLQVSSWREHWEAENLPYYLVQLASFKGKDDDPDAWPLLREAQYNIKNSIPNTELTTAIDIGDQTDIHPKNKSEVGHRLALLARALTYGQNVEYSGPRYENIAIEGPNVKIKFTHADGLTTYDDKTIRGFEIAGSDGLFTRANAKIQNDCIVLNNPQVENPKAVRYNWHSFPNGNLINAAGLPAFPFRSDTP